MGQTGAPNQPSSPLLKSRFFVPSKAWTPHRLEASPDPHPLLLLQGLVCGETQLLQLPHPRVPRFLQDTSLVLLNASNAVISCPVPWNARRPGNVECAMPEVRAQV